MNNGSFSIEYGICGDEQQSSFMNATLSTHGDNFAVSVAVEPSFPEEFDFTDEAAVETHLRALFAPLVAAGCEIKIQCGPDEEIEEDEDCDDEDDDLEEAA